MTRRLTKLEVINKAHEVHGYKYIYDKMEYVNNSTKICIGCKEHGDFWQTPINHLSGQGCPFCGKEKSNKTKRKTFELFVEKAIKIHGNRYIYDKDSYVDTKTKTKIICKEHGDFWQTPDNHLQGKGCPFCGGRIKSNTSEFIREAKKVHGDKYIYDEDKTNYVNSKTKVCITCREHGDFWQYPYAHLTGQGCPECAKIAIRKKLSSNTTEFIIKAKAIHGDKYIYDKEKINYINSHTKICITCKIHGDFLQTPNDHLNGYGCPKCGGHSRLTTEDFCEKAKTIHTNNNYVYDYVDYKNYDTPIKIVCPIHGEFWQTPDAHLHGHGCPKCGSTLSKGEDEINDFINTECHTPTITRGRKLLGDGLECDIIVPSYKLAIEFNGLYWHSEAQGKDKNYHLHKTELAESKGYHLIHIFEDEWLEHKDIVLNKIRHFLGCDIDRPVVGARKCAIKTVSKALVEPFLTSYHLQGFVASTAYYGAFYGDILVGVMTFKQEKKGEWNLTRFATDTNYRLPGLASKIFKQFIKDCSPVEVKTFLDRRWSHGDVNLYDRMGFKLVETLAPDYRYVVKTQRLHKFGFRKQILHKKYGLPLTMTEKEMTEQLGFYRIWDCGLYKYVWRKE